MHPPRNRRRSTWAPTRSPGALLKAAPGEPGTSLLSNADVAGSEPRQESVHGRGHRTDSPDNASVIVGSPSSTGTFASSPSAARMR